MRGEGRSVRRRPDEEAKDAADGEVSGESTEDYPLLATLNL